jgi:tetratricopeptide (TPR) repeat protein
MSLRLPGMRRQALTRRRPAAKGVAWRGLRRLRHCGLMNWLQAHRDPKLLTFILGFAAACLLLAILGGPVQGLGFSLPAAHGFWPRLAMGVLGVALGATAVALWPPHRGADVVLLDRDRVPAGWGREVRPRLTPRFTGRRELLERLETHLTRGIPTVLVGLGGVGKTQAALAYIDRHERDYEYVWWLRAEDRATLIADYAALAGRLPLPGRGESALSNLTSAVRAWLEQHHGWLLIFDNAEDVDLIKDFLPAGRRGHVLITSRLNPWPDCTSVGVKPFRRSESMRLLRHGSNGSRGDDAGYSELANQLGDLPLALEQAVAYLQETGISPSDYVALLRSRAEELVSRGMAASYEETVATTWSVSLRRAEQEEPSTRQLLSLFAFLSPDGIPRDLLPSAQQVLPDSLTQVVSNTMAYNDAVGALVRYSLLTTTPEELTVHRLVQVVVRSALSSRDRRRWASSAVRLVQSKFPVEATDPETWPTCTTLLPHALTAAEHCETLGLEPELTAQLLNAAGVYLESRAEFDVARRLHERALEFCANQSCAPMTRAVNLNNLGHVLYRLARWEESKAAHEEALAIYEQELGHDHPRLAEVLNRLGGALFNLGDMAGARTVYQRAFEVCSAASPSNPAETAVCLNNLGIVLRDMGELEEARDLLEQALRLREEAFHSRHPEIARSLNNLGMVLRRLGDHGRARNVHERALAIHEDIYGDDHPTLAVSVQCLGLVDLEEGRLERAEARLRRALEIFERHHAPDHWLVRECREQHETALRRMES